MQPGLIGVIGAGVMGQGVVESLLRADHRVVLVDTQQPALDAFPDALRRSLQLRRLWKRGPFEDVDQFLERLTLTRDYAPLRHASFVIENVTERWEAKREVHQTLDRLCNEDATIAANTSAISITRIASLLRNPGRVLGMHFMNPVPSKDTVEIVRGFHSTELALERARALLASMNMRGIVVNDSPGFVSNRVLMLTVNEAIGLVSDSVASAEDVDEIFRSCFSHKMGPLETADLIGLDTILLSLEVLQESFGDPKYRPHVLLKKMVDAGLHGRKSGRGFFSYES